MALCKVTELNQQCPSTPGSPTAVPRCSRTVPRQPEPPCWAQASKTGSTQTALSSQPLASIFSPTQGRIFI